MRSTKRFLQGPRARLALEQLESREVLTGVQPTAVEQLFLELLNDARANPAAYGQSIGLDLSNIAPSQPLAFNPQLIQAARAHSQDMNNRGYFAHNTPEGLDPGGQITQAGFAWTSWGQSIAGGTAYPGPSEALRGLIIDSGVPDLGHRRHLLAIDQIFQPQNQAGIGIVQAGTGPLVDYYTIDTASSADLRPMLTGVLYNDLNKNGHYDIGEGLAGVTITVAGVGSTTTFDSGGYSLPVAPGSYTVTATGGALGTPITRTVTVGLTNTRLTLVTGGNTAADTAFVQHLYQVALGRPGSAAEISTWVGALETSVSQVAIASSIEHSAEARARLVQGWYASYLNRSPGAGEQQAWVSAMLNGATEEDVLSAIVGSAEYYARTQSIISTGTADQRYIQALYTTVMGRTGSAGEIATWLSLVQSGARNLVVGAFVHSGEYRGNAVRADYTSLLHRSSAPSAGEIATWVNSGLDLTGIRIGFEGSREFYVNS